MKNIHLIRVICLMIAVSSAILFLQSCKKSTNYNGGGNTGNGILFNNSESTNGTIYGQVVHEDGTPMEGAVVKIGSHQFTTTSDGGFYFSKISTKRNATLIEVNKEKFFIGYRTLQISPNKEHYTRIMMIEKKNANTFSAISGGVVNVQGGGTITFPGNAIVYKSNNTVYNGTVTVYSKWLDPTSNQLSELMPGALRAIDANNYEKILQTFGMIGVEMFDDAGIALQIAPNKTAQMSFPIPASLSSSAPSSIPLWFFDATSGMWKEEGAATKQGSNYVGDVKHFSFWNCDVPSNFVDLDMILKDAAGNPLSNIRVKLTNTATGSSASGWTDGAGYVAGKVPSNATLTLEVILEPCGLVLHTQTVTTLTSAVSLGTIVVSVPAVNSATISGNVINCSANPITTGSVGLLIGTRLYYASVGAGGTFSSTIPLCTLPTSAVVTAYDYSTFESGTPTNVNLAAGLNPLGTLTACGVQFSFIEWTSTVGASSTTYTVTEPSALFYGGFDVSINSISSQDSVSGLFRQIQFFYDGLPSTSGTHFLTTFDDHLDNNSTPAPGIPVTLTAYGAVGNFITGSWSGTINGSMIPTRTVSCTFRVKRTF